MKRLRRETLTEWELVDDELSPRFVEHSMYIDGGELVVRGITAGGSWNWDYEERFPLALVKELLRFDIE